MTSWRDTYRVELNNATCVMRHQDPARWEAFSRRSLPTLDPPSTSIRLPIDPLDNSAPLGPDYNVRWRTPLPSIEKRKEKRNSFPTMVSRLMAAFLRDDRIVNRRRKRWDYRLF